MLDGRSDVAKFLQESVSKITSFCNLRSLFLVLVDAVRHKEDTSITDLLEVASEVLGNLQIVIVITSRDDGMSQGRVIDIMIIAFLQLTVLQFLERKNGFWILDVLTSEVLQCSVMKESGVNQKE